jgi:hypothetical protein
VGELDVMLEPDVPPDSQTSGFLNKLDRAFSGLCDAAKAKSELQYVLALCPEFRGSQDPGWCTWVESCRAFDEYFTFVNTDEHTPFKIRVALSFYAHLSEASGFYECPKNLLRIAGGEDYRMWPFLELNERHRKSGNVIAPNANKVFRDMIGHAQDLGFDELTEVLRDAFDPDIRNGYAHADYIIWEDGLRLRRQAGGHPRIIPWGDFEQAFIKAINFFAYIRQAMVNRILEYRTPKTLIGNLGSGPKFEHEVSVDERGHLRITCSGPQVYP